MFTALLLGRPQSLEIDENTASLQPSMIWVAADILHQIQERPIASGTMDHMRGA